MVLWQHKAAAAAAGISASKTNPAEKGDASEAIPKTEFSLCGFYHIKNVTH